jgi:hypothetical protein
MIRIMDDTTDTHSEPMTAEEIGRLRLANISSSHLLLPDSQLDEAFKGQSMVKLVQYKERFGISLAAMIYRARESNKISESTYKWLWIEFSRRGWRKKEPGHVRADRATRFEQLIDEAISSKRFTWSELSRATEMREEVLRERISAALGASESSKYSHQKEEAEILHSTDESETESDEDGGMPNVLPFPK